MATAVHSIGRSGAGGPSRKAFFRPTPYRMIAFACGLPAIIPLSLSGELFLGEIALTLLALGLVTLSSGKAVPRSRLFHALMLALATTLLGYVLSDLARGSKPENYLRGWARVSMLGMDALALTILALQDPADVWWYSLGSGLGSLATNLVWGLPLSQAMWKFGYSLPYAWITLCLTSFMGQTLTTLVMGGSGIMNVLLDNRAIGGVFALTGVLVWSGRSARSARGSQVLRLGVVLTLTALAIFYAYETSNQKNRIRRLSSDAFRRVNMETALRGIIDEPLLGHGSWAADPVLKREFLAGYRILTGKAPDPGSTFRAPHSEVLAVWFEGGALGLVFVLYFGYQVLAGLRYCAFARPFDSASAMYLYLMIQSMWHLILSPAGGAMRLQIAFVVSILCVLAGERSRTDVPSATPSPQRQPKPTWRF